MCDSTTYSKRKRRPTSELQAQVTASAANAQARRVFREPENCIRMPIFVCLDRVERIEKKHCLNREITAFSHSECRSRIRVGSARCSDCARRRSPPPERSQTPPPEPP